MTRKLIQFDLFCFKLFPPDSAETPGHQVGEMRNKITPSSCIVSLEYLYQKLLKSNSYGWWCFIL